MSTKASLMKITVKLQVGDWRESRREMSMLLHRMSGSRVRQASYMFVLEYIRDSRAAGEGLELGQLLMSTANPIRTQSLA
jgi:hypothetical protein